MARTMTIQTQTPGGQKPPTLAELRKMAKRKGLRVVDRGFGPDDVVIASGLERRALFAYLSAFPDKERAR